MVKEQWQQRRLLCCHCSSLLIATSSVPPDYPFAVFATTCPSCVSRGCTWWRLWNGLWLAIPFSLFLTYLNSYFELEVGGPRHDLHSGRYGGAVLNPLQALCEIITRLHDHTGRVSIPGFYRRVHEISPAERQELRCCAPSETEILTDLDLPMGWGEAGYSLFERMTIRPALTVNGLIGGYTGPGDKSVIPAQGRARLSMRLVPEQEPGEIAHLLRRHIAAIKPAAVYTKLKITGGSPPVIIPRRHPILSAATHAIYQVWGVPPVFTRSGGTIPLVAQLQRRFKVPIILLGFGLPDDDIHAPNEKISLPNFFRGIETIIRFLEECRR